MNISLEYFLAVAEEESISRAAERVMVSQQDMSNHIRRLEKQYGLLFERRPRFALTPAGEAVLEGALDLPGTKVLMKAGSRMDQVFQALERRGLLDRSALVQDCGLPTQRVFPDLSRPPEDTGYFSTIVVKESVS